jgi:hypothetical protein
MLVTTLTRNGVLFALTMLATLAMLSTLSACQQTESGVGGPKKALVASAFRPEGGAEWDTRLKIGPFDKNGMLICVYDARPLLHPLTDFHVPRATTNPDNGKGRSIFDGAGGDSNYQDAADLERHDQVERFLGMIRATVLPESWEPNGRANLKENDGLLVVRQTPQGHRLIAHLLKDLIKNRPVQISVEFRAFDIPAARLRGLWQDQPQWLTDKEASRLIVDLLKTSPPPIPFQMRVTLFDGHQACIIIGTETGCIPAIEPVRDPFRPDEESADVRATVSADRKHVTLSVRFITARYRASSQPDGLDGSRYEDQQELGATTIVPNAHTAVWTWIQGQRGLLLLIRPQILPNEPYDQ